MIYLTRVADNKRLHEMAWRLLSHALGGNSPLPVCFGPHGKPYLEDEPFFSISHTKGLALCAVEEWNTGLDAERKRFFSPRLQERVFTPAEREMAAASSDPDALFTILWTLKESYMKYTGLGLAEGAAALNFQFIDGQPMLKGKNLYFRTAAWEDYYISQCGPEPFELALCAVEFHEN